MSVGISRGLSPVLSRKYMPNSGCNIRKMNFHSKKGLCGYEDHCATWAPCIIVSELQKDVMSGADAVSQGLIIVPELSHKLTVTNCF